MLSNPETSGKLIKWTIELSEYNIQYHPRTTIKAQVMTNFLAETIEEAKDEVQKVFVDGSSTKQGSSVGVWLLSPQGEELSVVARLNFKASNNEVEYDALLAGL